MMVIVLFSTKAVSIDSLLEPQLKIGAKTLEDGDNING